MNFEMPARKRLVFIIEKTKDGFSGYARDYPVFTTAGSMTELLKNSVEALSLYFDDNKLDVDRISYEIDFRQFFKYYRVINSKALAGKIGMNPTLLSQYISGHKKPSESQSRRILYGINTIGQELAEMSVIYNKDNVIRKKSKIL